MSDKEYNEEVVNSIMDVAMHTLKDNIIPTELSFQQALSVYLRSEQLKRESKTHPANNPARKAKEIETCWKKRFRKPHKKQQ